MTRIALVLRAVAAVLAVGALIGLVVLREPAPDLAGADDPANTLVEGTIVAAVEQPVGEDEAASFAPGSVPVKLTVRRADTGAEVTFTQDDQTGGLLGVGRRVVLNVNESPGLPPSYGVVDIVRRVPLLLLTALFVGAVLAFGRWHGARALVGLALSAVLIVGWFVPSVLGGANPLTVGLVAALAIMLVTLYLTHGLHPMTDAAAVGTAVALGLTALLAVVFTRASSITGLTSEDAVFASFALGGADLRGLFLAGVVLGGLGVLDDVTVAQSSTVFALRRADPTASTGHLVREALSVGRDHVAATVNTLFLAYAGASLPLLLLFALSGEAVASVAQQELVAVEVVRTLVGSLGLIAALPATTVFAALVADPAVAADADGHGHAHGVVAPVAARTVAGGERGDAPPAPAAPASAEAAPASAPPAPASAPTTPDAAGPDRLSEEDRAWLDELRGGRRPRPE